MHTQELRHISDVFSGGCRTGTTPSGRSIARNARRWRSTIRVRRGNEGQAYPVLLDPGDVAVVDGGAVGNDKPKARRHEGGIVDIDGGAVRGNVANHAAHDRAA